MQNKFIGNYSREDKMHMSSEANWIQCDGGPHILIEKKYLKIWKGETNKEAEDSMRYYEEASQIDDYISELKLGLGKCLIISDDVPMSTWISNGNKEGILVVVNYIDEKMTEDVLFNEINKIPDDEYNDIGLTYQITDNELYLFAACDFGADWMHNYCKVNLLPSNYNIKMIEEYKFQETSVRLFKFLTKSIAERYNALG